MKKKKIIALLLVVIIIIAILCGAIIGLKSEETKLVSVKSEKELMSIYEGERENNDVILGLTTMPFSLLMGIPTTLSSEIITDAAMTTDSSTLGGILNSVESATSNEKSSSIISLPEKEHSTTNIQVENVDEADITKTDGNYIYSISEDNVIITNVIDPENIKIEAKIKPRDEYFPEELILYKDKLVVISTQYISYNKSNTFVNVYDITTKSRPRLIEEYTLYEGYYTSRCIDGKLYVIASGRLREEDEKIVTYYDENNEQKDIGLSNIKYIKGLESNVQTIIASLNLNTNEEVKVNSYLFNVENAYISEHNMYLLNEEYKNDDTSSLWQCLKSLFGFGGVIGYGNAIYDYEYDYNQYTNIYKFKICDDGSIEFTNKTKVKGTTINQFSLDEYNDSLRVGLYTYDGSRIVVFDKELNQIGETPYLSKGEKMYSTRFIENKAYMVTYKNTDPLYVIDLSNPSDPTVLGKLKIPGYSTYLHPYDENHLIGIGMQTEEKVYRNSSGKITSTRTVITGMKMALFDVSDVNNPIQISQTIIGDSRTTSAILTNHKALLFSAEKGIIAIPVNTYPNNFEIETSSSNISSMVNSYTTYNTSYTSEGYFVYNINLTDGFKLKGVINHEKTSAKKYYSSYYSSKLLRGMWIEDNLYTVSEDMIKVNKLDNLTQISELKIKEGK